MRALTTAFNNLPLHQQLATVACLCCLLSSLALVALAGQSSAYTRANLQAEYGRAVAEQLARRLGTEMATGDLLGVVGELNKLTEQRGIAATRALDVDGNELAVAGDRELGVFSFSSAIVIAGDQAGVAEVALNTAAQDRTQFQFLLSLSGLAILLSIAVYIATRALACLLYTSPSPRDVEESRMPSSA